LDYCCFIVVIDALVVLLAAHCDKVRTRL
jgi:hypothetical protein